MNNNISKYFLFENINNGNNDNDSNSDSSSSLLTISTPATQVDDSGLDETLRVSESATMDVSPQPPTRRHTRSSLKKKTQTNQACTDISSSSDKPATQLDDNSASQNSEKDFQDQIHQEDDMDTVKSHLMTDDAALSEKGAFETCTFILFNNILLFSSFLSFFFSCHVHVYSH
jgi:hypothetical protein